MQEALVKGGVNPLIARAMTPGQLAGILEQQWKVTPIVTCSNGCGWLNCSSMTAAPAVMHTFLLPSLPGLDLTT